MLQYLQNLDWPGNIRELSNGIARHVLIGTEARIVQKPVAQQSHSAEGKMQRSGELFLLNRSLNKLFEKKQRSCITRSAAGESLESAKDGAGTAY